MSSLDIAVLGQLTADQVISPTQFAWLLTASPADAQLIVTGLESLKSLQNLQPEIFAQAREALFAAKGGPSSPMSTSSSASFSTTTTTTTTQDSSSSTSTSADSESLSTSSSSEKKEAEENREVAEVVAICIDVSGSMSTKFEKDGQVDASAINQNAKSIGRTRLEAVKQMFYGFRDQTCTFEYGNRHRLGLISYDDKITVLTEPTNKMDEFEAVIDKLKCGGSTAMYEAIHACCKMLEPWRAKYPTADMRVLCLSDGENNCHKISAEQALQALQNVEACVDFLLVGNCPDSKVLQLVQATEGECYQITTLSEGFDCLESRGVISLSARRNGAPKPEYKRETVDLSKLKAAPIIRAGQPQAQAQSAAVASLKVMSSSDLAAVSSSSSTSSVAPARQKRVLMELSRFDSAGLDQTFKIFPGSTQTDGTIDFIKVLMMGHPGSSYESGVFELLLEFPSDYPFKPPKLNFVTPIYHYAVSAQGRICSDVLTHSWSPALHFYTALRSVYDELFVSPDPTCERSLRSWLSELRRVQPDEYERNARQFTEQEANESLAEASARIVAGLPKPPSTATLNSGSAADSSAVSITSGISSAGGGNTTQFQDIAGLPVTDLQTAIKNAVPSGTAQKRILSELKKFDEAKLDHRFRVFPGEGNLEYLKILLAGKEGTPYEGGIFELFANFPSDYPFKPPNVKFVTPVYHYAVSEQGKICSPVLADAWSPSVSLLSLLPQLYADLMDCDTNDATCERAVRNDLASLKKSNQASYEANARQCTQQHARKGFEDLSSPSLIDTSTATTSTTPTSTPTSTTTTPAATITASTATDIDHTTTATTNTATTTTTPDSSIPSSPSVGVPAGPLSPIALTCSAAISASQKVHPLCRYAESKQELFLTFESPGSSQPVLTLSTDSVCFARDGYECELKLKGSIVAQSAKWDVSPQEVALCVRKTNSKRWHGLLAQKKEEKNLVRADFDRWIESDNEEEDQLGFDTSRMGALNS